MELFYPFYPSIGVNTLESKLFPVASDFFVSAIRPSRARRSGVASTPSEYALIEQLVYAAERWIAAIGRHGKARYFTALAYRSLRE